MPLLRNTFQPFFPDPDSPATVDCGDRFCNLIQPGDIIRQEWYQTPCNASIVVDPDFEDFTLGADMITNGTFTTNADDWFVDAIEVGSTACPAEVNSWCFNVNRLGHDGTNGEDDEVYQTGIGLVAGNIYQVVWTVQGRTQGSIYTRLGETINSTSGASQVTNETFTEYLYYNDTQDVIAFFPSADFDGSIDNITCKLVTMTSWVGLHWVFDDGFACVPVANASVGRLYNLAPTYIDTGDYYTATYTLNIQSGSIQMYVDDGAGGVQTNIQTADTTSGTYTKYFTSLQDGTIGFDPSADFSGCISGVTVQRLRDDYTFELINSVGDSVDVSNQTTYIENKIYLHVDLGTMNEAGTIDFGCYWIYAFDTCLISGENLVQDGTFSNSDYSEWIRSQGAWQYDMTGGDLEFIFEPLSDGVNLTTNSDFAAGDTGWTHDGSWTIAAGVGATHTPGSTTTLSQTITLSPPPVGFQFMYQWFEVVVSGRTAGSFSVTVSNLTSRQYSINDIITSFHLASVYGSVTISINPTSNFDGVIESIICHETHRPWSWVPAVANLPNPNVVEGNYQLDYTIVSVTGTTPGTQGASAMIQFPLAADFVYDVDAGAKSHTQFYTPGNTRIAITGSFRNNTTFNHYPGRSVVDNYSVVRVEPFDATYLSECIDFQPVHPNTKLLTAWCDQDALGSTYVDNFGFDTSDFLLQMRVRVRSYNPTFPTEGNVSKFGDGNARVTYAQIEKYWTLTTDYLSESAHTAIAAMLRCDHLMIGDTGTEDTEYVAEMEEFTPQWRAEGDYTLAIANIQIRKKTGGMKFNRHL